jgi:hypothetical protein
MSAHVLPPLAVNSKSERKVNSMPLLGLKLVIFGMLAHLSDHSAKSHPIVSMRAWLNKALQTEHAHFASQVLSVYAKDVLLAKEPLFCYAQSLVQKRGVFKINGLFQIIFSPKCFVQYLKKKTRLLSSLIAYFHVKNVFHSLDNNSYYYSMLFIDNLYRVLCDSN